MQTGLAEVQAARVAILEHLEKWGTIGAAPAFTRGRCTDVIELRDETYIEVPPETVWAWLETMPDHYVEWHSDHVSCRWRDGTGLAPGAELEVVEMLHGKKHRLRIRLTALEPGRWLSYSLYPGANGWFELADSAKGTRFTAEITLGVNVPIIGKLIDLFLLSVMGGRIAAIRKHQAEEGENLKALLESAAGTSG